MKHLEESNATNQAELEEDGDLAEIEREKRAEEHAAKCASPANRQGPDSNAPNTSIPVSTSTRPSVDASPYKQERDETVSPVTLTTTVGPTTHDTLTNRIELSLMATKAEIEEEKEESPVSSSINVPVINVTKEEDDPHSSMSTLNREDSAMKKSFEEYDPESTEEELKPKGIYNFSLINTQLNDSVTTTTTNTADPTLLKKTLSRQVATEIVPQVVASIIYEESSDSDQNRVISQFRNQKRVGKKTRNQRR